jgi:hypothetical protein
MKLDPGGWRQQQRMAAGKLAGWHQGLAAQGICNKSEQVIASELPGECVSLPFIRL